MVVLYYLVTPIPPPAAAGPALALPAGRASIGNPGAHGLSEVVYVFTSAANRNARRRRPIRRHDVLECHPGLVMLLGRHV